MVLNGKRVGVDGREEEILYSEGSEALAQVAQRSCGCPLPGSVPGQAGRDFEQPGLVEGVSLKVPCNPNHSTILSLYFVLNIKSSRCGLR